MHPPFPLGDPLSGETPTTHECFPRRTAEEEEAALAQIAASQQNEREEEGAILKALRLLVEEIREMDKTDEGSGGGGRTQAQDIALAVHMLTTALDTTEDCSQPVQGSLSDLQADLAVMRISAAAALNILCGTDLRCAKCGGDHPTVDCSDPDKDDHSDAPRGIN